jgi:hypothetical protein
MFFRRPSPSNFEEPNTVNQRTLRAVLATAALMGLSLPARAQQTPWEDRFFANISFGVDTGTSDIALDGTLPEPVYGETATFQADAEFGSFAIFDIAFGARVYRNVGVAIGYHTGGTTGDGTVSGTVPHPQFFDRPRSYSISFDDAERDEHATHLQIGWMVPINDKFDVFIYGGPSFYQVTQELVTDIDFAEQGPPFTSVTVLPRVERQKDNATGYNFGVDGTYFVYSADQWRLGVGGFLRFTGATARFNAGGTEVETDAGGVQFAFGARVRF